MKTIVPYIRGDNFECFLFADPYDRFSYNKVHFMTSTLLGSNLSLILLIYTLIPFHMGYAQV